jgi:two-component system, NtrC family, nitrogen regulation response regulator NtrX
MNTQRILIVDDEQSIRDILRMTLEYEGYNVDEAESGRRAAETLRAAAYDAVILDVKMAGMDGIETLVRLKAIDPDVPVIMLTGHGTIETAVEATRKGAFDFLSKPPDREKILITLRNAFAQKKLFAENARLRRQIEDEEVIIGTAKGITELIATIDRIAPTEAFVLITGENGTGKELVAKAVHVKSLRRDRPLVEVNCAAIPTELIESELFGHEKGSFTGATAQRIGKFEQAHTGTLFLDEVGDMSLQAQAKVLRVLEEGTFERVGGAKLIRVDVRVIAATNKNLPQEIGEGKFREDLFHRLNVIPLQVPPLRDRREDIPLLIDHFLAMVCAKNKLPPRVMDRDAHRALQEMSWRGNVRELRNAIERLAIMVPGTITRDDVARFVGGAPNGFEAMLSLDSNFSDFKDRAEAMFIKRQLDRFQWNVSRTAEELQMQRSHLYNKMKKYGLAKDGEREEK